jgi:hypothetical protein
MHAGRKTPTVNTMGSRKDGRLPDSGDADQAKDRRGSRTPADPDAADPDAADTENLRVESLKGNVYSTVGFDAKGNAILEWRTDLPARRAEDDTVDYLQALDSDALRLAEEPGIAEPKSKSAGYNPYNKPK